MNKVTVITNSQPRALLAGYELPAGVFAREFDYLTEDDAASLRFFKYRGAWYDSHEFMRCQFAPAHGEMDPLRDWDGYASDSFFSGVLVRFVDDCERVIVGTYLS